MYKIINSNQVCGKARSPGEMVLLSPQLHLPRTPFLAAGDLSSWWHEGVGLAHGYQVSAGQHHPGESFTLELWLQLPCLPAPFGTEPRQHQERRVPGEGGSQAKDWHCHSSTQGHCASRRKGGVAPSFLCTLKHNPFLIYGPLTPLCCEQWLKQTGCPRPKLRLLDSSSPAGSSLEPHSLHL